MQLSFDLYSVYEVGVCVWSSGVALNVCIILQRLNLTLIYYNVCIFLHECLYFSARLDGIES